MNEQKYNNQDIIEYLLGSLPESEAERFDELSFTADDFAVAVKIAENDLIDGYVNSELTGATLEKFESHYLASPLRREKVDFAKAFQAFAERNIKQQIESPAVKNLKPKRTIGGFFSAINIFTNRTPLLQWGFIAATLAFVFLGGLWIVSYRLGQPENQIATQNTPAQTNRELPKPIEKEGSATLNREREVAAVNVENESLPQNSEKELANKQPVPAPTRTPKQPSLQPAIASLILAPSLRGNSRITNLLIDEKTSAVAVRLQLESDDYAAYRVALTDETGSVNLWRGGTLKTKIKGDDKFLNFRFPAKLLKSRIYSLTVSGINSNGEAEIIGNYPFRSVLK